MTESNIYIELSTSSPKDIRRHFGYVLEHKAGTRETFGEIDGTVHAATLRVMISAIKRYRVRTKITVYIKDKFIVNMLRNLETWKASDYITARGEPVANAEEWRVLAELMEMHEITIKTEKNSFENWIKEELKHVKSD